MLLARHFQYCVVNPIQTGLFENVERNFSALCCVGLKFVFPNSIFIAVTSEKKFFSKIERCINPRPAVMTRVKKMSCGLFLFFLFFLFCIIIFFVGTFLDPCHANCPGVSTPLNFRIFFFFFRSNRDKKNIKS